MNKELINFDAKIERLTSETNIPAFDCGKPDLNNFLKRYKGYVL